MHGMNVPLKIQCFNFDLDSVLYLPNEFLETTLILSIKAMIQVGLETTTKEGLKQLKLIRSINSNAQNHFDQLCYHFNQEYDPVIIAAGIEKYWDCKIGNMTSAPDTLLILNELYQKYPLAIITNGRPIKQAGKILRLGLYPYFLKYDDKRKVQKRFFYVTDNKNRVKPHPWLWEKAQKDIGFDFNKTVMVGDRFWEDILGANLLGMLTIKINQGYHSNETIEDVYELKKESGEIKKIFRENPSKNEIMNLMKPQFTIRSLKELPRIAHQIENSKKMMI
jgi:putative hydrolase of the HAD superfamily